VMEKGFGAGLSIGVNGARGTNYQRENCRGGGRRRLLQRRRRSTWGRALDPA